MSHALLPLLKLIIQFNQSIISVVVNIAEVRGWRVHSLVAADHRTRAVQRVSCMGGNKALKRSRRRPRGEVGPYGSTQLDSTALATQCLSVSAHVRWLRVFSIC